MEKWNPDNNLEQEIDAYLDMIIQIVEKGFILDPLSVDKLDTAKSWAIQALSETSDLDETLRRKLNAFIGKASAIIDTFG